MMSRAIKAVGFKFHSRCEKLQLTIPCFGDNKIIFTSADLGSVSIIKNVFDKFKILSCLQANTGKNEVFFSGEFEGTKFACSLLKPNCILDI